MARAAGEKPPGIGYMGCPGLHKRDTLSIELWLFTLPECRFYSQPSKRMCDLSHSSGRDGVTSGVRAPGYSCSTSGIQLIRAHLQKDRCPQTEEGRCCAVYLCQERNSEMPAEERRPPGCRTAVGGGGSCEGAAPSTHCSTADINAR